MSEDISPYCLAHDEWLIMKLCMCVGYHVANNVSHFGGDPVTRLHFVNVAFKKTLFYGHGALGLRLFLGDHAQAAGVWKTDAVNL